MEENMFFTFYWLLTGFHFIHVVVGLVILVFLLVRITDRRKTTKIEDIEAGGAFWHMCDLIWLLLFPTLYLVF
jgi:nitric oxide reductase NorE protein